jgi:putative Holliday junction resolvase
MALPRLTLARSGHPELDRQRLADLVVEEGAAVVVVGLPLSLDGTRGPAALAAVTEAEALGSLLQVHGIAVELYDERLTTVTAHQALATTGANERARRPVVDQAAAAVLLEAWLAWRRGQTG